MNPDVIFICKTTKQYNEIKNFKYDKPYYVYLSTCRIWGTFSKSWQIGAFCKACTKMIFQQYLIYGCKQFLEKEMHV